MDDLIPTCIRRAVPLGERLRVSYMEDRLREAAELGSFVASRDVQVAIGVNRLEVFMTLASSGERWTSS